MKKTIDDYVLDAERRSTPPPTPKQGIKKQRVPAFIRWTVHLTFLPFMWLDLFAQKIAKKIIRPPFKQEGGCKMRGTCCYYIIMQEPTTFLSKINFYFNTEINAFFLRDIVPVAGEKRKAAVMGCRWLEDSGKCRHHFFRPVICRQYPRIEYFEKPRLLKGCGYKAVPRTKSKSPHHDNFKMWK